MTCLIKGCNFVLKNIPHEAFAYQKDADPEFRFQTNHPNIFPYLLVNIGSGVSIVKVAHAAAWWWPSGAGAGPPGGASLGCRGRGRPPGCGPQERSSPCLGHPEPPCPVSRRVGPGPC